MLRALARAWSRIDAEANDLIANTLLEAVIHISDLAPATNRKAWLLALQRGSSTRPSVLNPPHQYARLAVGRGSSGNESRSPAAASRRAEVVAIDAIPDDAMILDIGPDSANRIAERIADVRTLVWNGPLGVAEQPAFAKATEKIVKTIAERTRAGNLISVVGGGDTNAAVARAGVFDDFSYVSLAGGAFLEWLEGRELPGLVALDAAEG
ncbi:MAG: phosphoglycerate kinase [Gammaproteobacteria bacterium]